MKLFFITTLLFFITSCGEDSHIDSDHLIDVGSGGNGISSENCTVEALQALDLLASLCDKALPTPKDKALCVKNTKEYRLDYPGAVCNLEGQVIVTEKFITEELTSKDSDSTQELIDSGFFDE